jgi:hypothetical protein
MRHLYDFFIILKTRSFFKVSEDSFIKKINNDSGQTFVEFILLLSMMSVISYTFLGSMNGYLVKIWKEYISFIVSENNIEIR